MATNKTATGRVIYTTNVTGSDVATGGAMVCGKSLRIALVAIASGSSGNCDTEGVYTLAATSADAWVDGDVLYWDASTAKLTNSTACEIVAGIAVGLKAALTTTANVKLLPGRRLFDGATTSAAASLAIPVTHRVVHKTTGAGAEALTLADGIPGQRLTIDLATDGGGDGTLTPTTKSGFATIVFADAGDNVTLEFVDSTVGWVIVGAAGVAAPPVITI